MEADLAQLPSISDYPLTPCLRQRPLFIRPGAGPWESGVDDPVTLLWADATAFSYASMYGWVAARLGTFHTWISSSTAMKPPRWEIWSGGEGGQDGWRSVPLASLYPVISFDRTCPWTAILLLQRYGWMCHGQPRKAGPTQGYVFTHSVHVPIVSMLGWSQSDTARLHGRETLETRRAAGWQGVMVRYGGVAGCWRLPVRAMIRSKVIMICHGPPLQNRRCTVLL